MNNKYGNSIVNGASSHIPLPPHITLTLTIYMRERSVNDVRILILVDIYIQYNIILDRGE